jgi:hypothetical protein
MSVIDRMDEILAQAMTPDIAGSPETHVLPQWAEDLNLALDALRLLRSNPIGREAQVLLKALFEDEDPHP